MRKEFDFLPFNYEDAYTMYMYYRKSTPRDHYHAWADTCAIYPDALPYEQEMRLKGQQEWPETNDTPAKTWR